MRSFYNGRKVPLIPPILKGNKYVSDFKEKANYFNEFFSLQFSPVVNSSVLPDKSYLTASSLESIAISASDILKTIRSLDINKANGHDDISVRMMKICDDAIAEPLKMLFVNSVNQAVFPSQLKKANLNPVHKKNEKYIVNNYRPVSLLPIASKIFEKAIYHNLLNYIERENLLNINQSGFHANDNCINQLISMTHEIYRAFNCNPSLEVKGIFLDLSKAFDKVWHQGLLFKLESFEIRGKLLNLLKDYLSNRFQRVLLNGQESSWLPIKAGVPQGSILGPLLFLIYINDLPDGLNSIAKLFADDTFLFSIVQDPNESAKYLNLDLSVISQWAYQLKTLFNPDPKKPAHEVIFSRKENE